MKSIVIHFAIFFVISQVSATIINVPADQATIQGAITAATVVDTVLVQPGTYTENINFGGKDLVVMSAAGPESTP